MSDPTAIQIDFDPTRERMSGTAVHGNTPFDVPYMSHIDGNLWTGGCRNGLNLPTDIAHVVSLYPWEQYTVRHELRSRLEVRMYDSADGEPDAALLAALAVWVSACLDDGPTLVHCQAGLNRSALVAASALHARGVVPEDAIALLRGRRSPAVLCNPVFHDWLIR